MSQVFTIKMYNGQTATINQDENGTYRGEIRDENGWVQSATTKKTSDEVKGWIWDHDFS